ncbi:MAG: bifunctional nuclease family protein [Thermodesulfobacteriota bacterium]
MEGQENMIAIHDVQLVEQQDGYQIILKEKADSKYYFTMLIGPAEFAAIAKEKGTYRPPRPLTHDLYLGILKNLGVRFLRVEIYDQQDNAYIAKVIYEKGGNEVGADSRPSDALALALNQRIPILVTRKLFKTEVSKEEKEFYRDIIKVVKFKETE